MNGTGPFMFKEWVPGDHVTIVKNPNYWDSANAAHLDAVTFKKIADVTAVLNALQSGAAIRRLQRDALVGVDGLGEGAAREIEVELRERQISGDTDRPIPNAPLRGNGARLLSNCRLHRAESGHGGDD